MSENVVLGFVNPDYENIRVLNQLGGTGDLFIAHKRGMNIDVVIKRTQLRYQHRMNQETESNILKNLKHQYLPRIYDVIYGSDGCVYTVMDLISGQNLQQYVKEHGPVSQKNCYRWACQLCEVVQYLHQENSDKPAIIHCDIKPGNVMITSSGNICLIDFNTSLIFRQDKQAVGVTDGYAAPEQYRNASKPQAPGAVMQDGETLPLGAALQANAAQAQKSAPSRPQKDYGPISRATDIYSIGATLYYAVTGHRPEKSLGKVTPLEQFHPKISRSMQTIIVRAMQKQQTRRFQQASEMLRVLKNIDRMDRSYKSYQVRKWVTAAVLLACFGASAFSCYYGTVRMRSERENTYLLNLAQAEQAEQNADYDQAQELLERSIRQQPGRADGYLQLAVLLYRTGDYQGAIDRLDSALNSGNLKEKTMDAASAEQLHYIKGNCYMELEDYDQAVAELQRAVQQKGAGTDSYRSLAIALANAGQLEQAQQTLATLRAEGGSAGDCDLVEAEILSLQKEPEQALTLYQKVFDEVTDTQMLSHAYLAAANTALQMDDTAKAIALLEQSQTALPEGQAVLQKEMLADVYLKKASSDKADAETCYTKAQQLLQELIRDGYGTIATRLNLATALQALGRYSEAEDVLTELKEQYPSDYRFDMQLSYLLIDWQGTLPVDTRDYHEAKSCYDAAVEKYRQAQANGTEDAQMAVLKNLIAQLQSSGWLE